MDYKDYILQKSSDDLYFWHRARNILVYNLFYTTYKNYSPDRLILDIGCGTGTILGTLKKFGRVTALDNNRESIDLVKKQGHKAILDNIETCELEKDRYDCVSCFDLLEHLKNDEAALHNIFLSLKKDGHFIFTVPAWQRLFGPHDLALEHKRRYSKKEIIVKLKKAGFKKITTGYWNFFLFVPAAIFRLIKILLYNLFKIKKYTPETKPINSYLNKILFFILNLENKLIKKGYALPPGLTIYGIAKK